MILAETVIQIDIASASVVSGGLVMAAKLLVWYFRDRDKRQDQINTDKDAAHKADMARILTDMTTQGTGFRDQISATADERRQMAKYLLDIQKETIQAVSNLTAQVQRLQWDHAAEGQNGQDA